MIKILMILSIAAMIVTGVFGWQNRQEFIKERKLKHGLRTEIEKLKDQVFKERDETSERQGVLTESIASRNISQERLDAAKGELAASIRKLEGLEAEIQTKTQELADLQTKLDAFAAQLASIFGQGIKIDDIEPKYAELKKVVDTTKEELDQLQNELAVAEGNLENKQKDLAGLVKNDEKRSKEFELNTLNARVVSVSNDWGFLVLDAGKNQGVTGSTQFLVVRPGQGGICKLSIIDIADNRTTANIVQNTLAPGEQVQVGDRVIVNQPR